MDRNRLTALAEEFVRTSAENRIEEKAALSPEAAGFMMYEPPIFSIAAADDPLFWKLKEPGVIGGHFKLPQEWLAEASTVVTFFLAFTERVTASNARPGRYPSPEWLHARSEGQEFINSLTKYLVGLLEGASFKAVAPSLDSRFFCRWSPVAGEELGFTSNWSERHAAFVAGLGTFGLSKGIITKKGMAGRLSSIITAAPFATDDRDYKEVYQYCIRCGACARKCPVQGISLESGKNHSLCGAFLEEAKELFAPRYACGKCQAGTPCTRKVPEKKRETNRKI